MDIMKVVYFTFVMCLVKGFDCSLSSNGTLVITDHDCTESYTTIINNTRIQYQPVTYRDVLENEDTVLELLANGDKVHLSERGEILTVPSKGCFRFTKSDLYISNQIKKILMSSSQQEEDCTKRNHGLAGVIPSTCGCVILEIDFFRTYFHRVNELYCMAYGSKNSNNTGDIYMWVFDLNADWRELAFLLKTSCLVLSRYIVYPEHTDLYSRSGLLTDGVLCTLNKYTNESEYCTPLVNTNRTKPTDYLIKDLSLCVSTSALNEYSIVKNVRQCSPTGQALTAWDHNGTHAAVLDHMNETKRNVYSVYRNTLTFLRTYDDPLFPCISLVRRYDNIFVGRLYYYRLSMNYLCRRTSYAIGDSNSEDHTLHTTLITGGVIVFISSVVILCVVTRRVVRRCFNQNANTPHGDQSDNLDNNTAIQLHSIGSSDDGSVTGPVAVAGSVPGPIGSHRGSSVTGPVAVAGSVPGPIGSHRGSSVTGPVAVAGSVPGRTDATTAAQSTTYDAVPGRTSRGYNFHYAQR